jgi:MoaA/NifB/PqqE/SkfB family radical SAM enzyme
MQPIRFDQHKFPVKQLQGKYCITPFILISIAESGQVYLCGCTWWMSQPVGNILQSTLDEILSSDTAKNIRQSIIDGSYVYCNEKVCGVMANDGLNTIDTLPPNVAMLVTDSNKYNLPYHIHLSLDQTCNLSCPSCRERVILDTSGEYLAERYKWIDSIISWIRNSPDKRFDVIIGSNGDPFVSNVYLRCITEIQDLKNVNLSIKTNGLLAKYQLRKLDNIDNIKSLSVSIDAGSKEVYEKVRRGARWETLIDNLEYLSSLTHINKSANFVVQKLNFKDMKNFVELCRSYNMHSNFSHLSDWGTWHNFHEQCVHVPSSPHYAELKEILQDPIFRTANLGILKNI